ncbi:MAG TPA: adenylate cyclase regulatory domain-containing protein [Actinomycetota bacterium]|nr:adenylate cyclase regulatory domain-containing protein [Actinomycetota bacterium]
MPPEATPDAVSASRLAELAGVPVGFVERWAELGIVPAGEDGPAFRAADVGRIRLALACDRAGLPLDAIGKAVGEGRLSFAFMDLPQYGFARFTGTTYREVAAERGMPLEFLQRLHEAQGFARPDPDDAVREDDLPLISALQVALLFGMPEEPVVRMMRVYGESLRRVAEGENAAYRENVEAPLLAGGMDVGTMMATSSAFGAQYSQVMDEALLALYHRQQEHVWLSNMVERIEEALDEMGLVERLERPPAMCFLDLVGYTRLTEERGDAAAAELAAALAGVVQGVSQHRGGRPVKWLGDGVMFYFPDPAHGVVSALEMVEATVAAGLPPAHVGLHAGPVVRQDGDYFGRTVNLAARIAGRAGADEVLVSGELARVAADAGGVRFEDVGPASLKNVAEPVPLLRALRA